MGEGSKSIFEKPVLSVSRRNFFLKFQGGSPRSKRDSVNLTFNAFLHRKFSSRYIMVPGGGVMKGWCKIAFFVFLRLKILDPLGGGQNSTPPEEVRGGGSTPQPPVPMYANGI